MDISAVEIMTTTICNVSVYMCEGSVWTNREDPGGWRKVGGGAVAPAGGGDKGRRVRLELDTKVHFEDGALCGLYIHCADNPNALVYTRVEQPTIVAATAEDKLVDETTAFTDHITVLRGCPVENADPMEMGDTKSRSWFFDFTGGLEYTYALWPEHGKRPGGCSSSICFLNPNAGWPLRIGGPR